ncbi:uncharacterized protein LOC123546422 [Mercenaria mercenaria]|uniref:uncharacterized protein LOC123546422 n=1 Tax=Mercenaria mercenaria TaxID=6596 RepID=UPI00234E3BB6|nr:uncharacterized protein LOC123546422 [Mercenaria mercenaria]
MYRRMEVRYLYFAITLWCIGLDFKLLIYKPHLEQNSRQSMVVNRIIEIKSKVNFEAIEERNTQRIQTLRTSCKALGYLGDYSSGISTSVISGIRAHISPALDVLFCRVNKCGSTLALEVMRRVFDCDTDCLVDIAMNVKSSRELARKVFEKAFSFMIAREPYGRLFSSYGNLFYLPKEDWISRAVKIIKQVRKHPSEESLQFGHDLTFFELIKYIVHNYENDSYIDPHVRPMHHASCNPCSYRFDFLAKIETLSSDLEYLLHDWHSKHVINEYPSNIIADVKDWTTWGPLKHFYSTINLTVNSSIPLNKMYLRTWTYYQMKGLVSKQIDMPFRDSELWYIDFNIYRRILTNAMKLSESDRKNVENQRLEAMKQAYSTVPMEYMERLVNVVKDDCLLFGYEERPAFLFDRSTEDKTDFDYFKAL